MTTSGVLLNNHKIDTNTNNNNSNVNNSVN